MNRTRPTIAALALIALVGVTAVGCGQKDTDEERIRSFVASCPNNPTGKDIEPERGDGNDDITCVVTGDEFDIGDSKVKHKSKTKSKPKH